MTDKAMDMILDANKIRIKDLLARMTRRDAIKFLGDMIESMQIQLDAMEDSDEV